MSEGAILPPFNSGSAAESLAFLLGTTFIMYMKAKTFPPAYLITLTFYGNHLHGHSEGSVDCAHNQFESEPCPPNDLMLAVMKERLSERVYHMDSPRREITLEAIRSVCDFRNWFLIAGHVRSTHLHAVVAAKAEPEKAAKDFKSYASRALNRSGLDGLGQKKRWVCGLSRRYLWDIDSVVGAARYTIFRQGAPMSVYPTSPAQLDTLLRHWLGVDPQPWDAPL